MIMGKGRKTLITILIGLAFPLSELHRFWKDNYSQYDIFLGSDLKMDVAWIVKFISNDVRHILVAIALLLTVGYKKNKLIKALAITYVVFCGIDIGFLFWDFQRSYVLYGAAYAYIAIIFVWFYLFSNEKTNKLG